MPMRAFLLCVCLVSAITGAAQTDSLERALATAQGEQKVKVLNELFRARISSDPVRAIGHTREALALATEIADRKGMAAAYNNLGVAYKNQGALDKALEYYLTSLKINQSINNQDGVASTKVNIGSIYSVKRDYGQAMKYYEEAYQTFSQQNNREKLIMAMNNLGNLHSDLQLYEQAMKYYSQAWQLSEREGKPFGDPLANIGTVFQRQANYQRALEYYNRALDLAKKQQNRMAELHLAVNIGEVFTRARKPNEAMPYLQQALQLGSELNTVIYEPVIRKNMASNLAMQNRMKEAYEAMVEYDRIREKLFGEESTKKIAQMEIALQLQEKEAELRTLEQEKALKSAELRHTRLVIVVIVLSLLAAIALANIFLSKQQATR